MKNTSHSNPTVSQSVGIALFLTIVRNVPGNVPGNISGNICVILKLLTSRSEELWVGH